MVVDADDLEKHFTPEQLDQRHREHKVDEDPRVTRLGAFLRSSSIDGIPQFVNVFLQSAPMPLLVKIHQMS